MCLSTSLITFNCQQLNTTMPFLLISSSPSSPPPSPPLSTKTRFGVGEGRRTEPQRWRGPTYLFVRSVSEGFQPLLLVMRIKGQHEWYGWNPCSLADAKLVEFQAQANHSLSTSQIFSPRVSFDYRRRHLSPGSIHWLSSSFIQRFLCVRFRYGGHYIYVAIFCVQGRDKITKSRFTEAINTFPK